MISINDSYNQSVLISGMRHSLYRWSISDKISLIDLVKALQLLQTKLATTPKDFLQLSSTSLDLYLFQLMDQMSSLSLISDSEFFSFSRQVYDMSKNFFCNFAVSLISSLIVSMMSCSLMMRLSQMRQISFQRWMIGNSQQETLKIRMLLTASFRRSRRVWSAS